MIKITVPHNKDKWKISFGGTPTLRNNASVVYSTLERKLGKHLASQVGGKTSVRVIYDQRLGYENETLKSSDKNYLLRTTIQFLENYITARFLSQKERSYRDIKV